MLEGKHLAVEGGKPFFLIGRRNTRSCFNDCGDEKFLMDIDATAGLINDFHRRKTSFRQDRQEAIDCSAAHLTGVKTILSVRSRRATYLCLEGRTYTD